MDVILLERVAKLGQIGDVVRVKDGFGRNFLLAKGKALRATKDNKTVFEGMKAELQANNLKAKGEAEAASKKIEGKKVIIIRQAAESGQLYGSVTARDIVAKLAEDGVTLNKSQIAINAPIKLIGMHQVPVSLHPEVEVPITVTVARSPDEAERLARGENVLGRAGEADEAEVAAEAFFEPDAIKAQEGDEAEESEEKDA
jgi:large subunit ribosomal protein L9